MQYFISGISLYSAFNKKCDEVQERMREFGHTLITNKDALYKVVDSIKSIVADANGKYPQTKEFICHLTECGKYSNTGFITVSDVSSRSVASLIFHDVKNIVD